MKQVYEIKSRDYDEFTGFLTQRYSRSLVRPRGDAGEIGRASKAINLSGLSVEWTTTIGDYDVIQQDPFEANLVICTFHGGLLVERSGVPLTASAGQVTTFDAEPVRMWHKPADSQTATVCIHRDFSSERLSELLERPISEPLAFLPQTYAEDSMQRRFATLVQSTGRDEFSDDSDTPLVILKSIRDLIFVAALHLIPNNYSEALLKSPPLPSSRNVRTALDFMEAHLCDDLTIDVISRASGASVRSLQYAFKKEFGCGVMSYLKGMRMRRARKEIIRNPHEKVCDIVCRLGLGNFRRFTKQYEIMFGELPDSFLRR